MLANLVVNLGLAFSRGIQMPSPQKLQGAVCIVSLRAPTRVSELGSQSGIQGLTAQCIYAASQLRTIGESLQPFLLCSIYYLAVLNLTFQAVSREVARQSVCLYQWTRCPRHAVLRPAHMMLRSCISM